MGGLLRKIHTSFTGVAVYGVLVRSDHGAFIELGILSRGTIPEQEDLQGWVESFPFVTAEQFCADLSRDLDEQIPSKGSMVLVLDENHPVMASMVTGEVRIDKDVKQEMYALLGRSFFELP